MVLAQSERLWCFSTAEALKSDREESALGPAAKGEKQGSPFSDRTEATDHAPSITPKEQCFVATKLAALRKLDVSFGLWARLAVSKAPKTSWENGAWPRLVPDGSGS